MDKDRWSTRQQKLRQHLRDLRKNVGLTQIDLSEKLNRPQSYVSKYESGERRLDLFEVMDICNACEANISDLIVSLEDQ